VVRRVSLYYFLKYRDEPIINQDENLQKVERLRPGTMCSNSNDVYDELNLNTMWAIDYTITDKITQEIGD
jgi:hypothetical protein